MNQLLTVTVSVVELTVLHLTYLKAQEVALLLWAIMTHSYYNLERYRLLLSIVHTKMCKLLESIRTSLI
jgi:hypothetical protein